MSQLTRLQHVARQAWRLREARMEMIEDEDYSSMLENGLYVLLDALPEEDFGWVDDDEG